MREEDGQAGNEWGAKGPRSCGREDVLHPESHGEPLWDLSDLSWQAARSGWPVRRKIQSAFREENRLCAANTGARRPAEVSGADGSFQRSGSRAT